MKLMKGLTIGGGLAGLIAATYFGFGVTNQLNTAQAEGEKSSKWTTGATVSLESNKAKLGYLYGAQIGAGLRSDGLIDEIELNALFAAIQDLATGKKPRLSDEEMQQAQQAFVLKRQQELAVVASENKAKGEAFLESNGKKDGIFTTDSGLQYQIVREGKGKQPTATDTVKVHYLGLLIDGTPFDSSYQRNEPADFPVTGVIPGFSEGLQLMKEGAKYRFVIPTELAYGAQGPGSIGPNQVLIFEVELLSVLGGEPSGE